jgi:enamine deaminase RidA (YjgF/YER057c/UK114 family)
MNLVQQLPSQAVALAPRSGFGDFPMAIRVGHTVYMGAQTPALDSQKGSLNIEGATHAAFLGLVETLKSAGLSMDDLVKLHTYYVYEGEGKEVTQYWERMTQVRLQYLANPGPAATALRVKGAPTQSRLITVDGIATSSRQRQRLMPAHAWDWSIPTPFSQGWCVDDKVFVGGQISADRKGRAVAVGDVNAQTRATLDYIRHVLKEAGADWCDVVALKIAYRHDGRDEVARGLLTEILGVVRSVLPDPGPVLTCFGVDLLYEGLLLEIDAVATRREGREALEPPASRDWMKIGGFSSGNCTGNEIYVGGISAPGAASFVAQAEASMERVFAVLEGCGASGGNLVKLNVYFTSDDRQESRDSNDTARILSEYLPAHRPVVTIVRVPGLAHPGQRVQIDGIAISHVGEQLPLQVEESRK